MQQVQHGVFRFRRIPGGQVHRVPAIRLGHLRLVVHKLDLAPRSIGPRLIEFRRPLPGAFEVKAAILPEVFVGGHPLHCRAVDLPLERHLGVTGRHDEGQYAVGELDRFEFRVGGVRIGRLVVALETIAVSGDGHRPRPLAVVGSLEFEFPGPHSDIGGFGTHQGRHREQPHQQGHPGSPRNKRRQHAVESFPKRTKCDDSHGRAEGQAGPICRENRSKQSA